MHTLIRAGIKKCVATHQRSRYVATVHGKRQRRRVSRQGGDAIGLDGGAHEERDRRQAAESAHWNDDRPIVWPPRAALCLTTRRRRSDRSFFRLRDTARHRSGTPAQGHSSQRHRPTDGATVRRSSFDVKTERIRRRHAYACVSPETRVSVGRRRRFQKASQVAKTAHQRSSTGPPTDGCHRTAAIDRKDEAGVAVDCHPPSTWRARRRRI